MEFEVPCSENPAGEYADLSLGSEQHLRVVVCPELIISCRSFLASEAKPLPSRHCAMYNRGCCRPYKDQWFVIHKLEN